MPDDDTKTVCDGLINSNSMPILQIHDILFFQVSFRAISVKSMETNLNRKLIDHYYLNTSREQLIQDK